MNNKLCQPHRLMKAVVGLALLLAQGAIFGQQFTPFTKDQTINIPGSGTEGPASPFPSTITTSGLPGEVKRLQVTIHNFTHTNPDDVDAMLVYERPEKKNSDGVVTQTKRTRGFLFWSDTGGPHDVSKIDLTFDDKAGGSLPDDTKLSGGTFKPTNFNTQPGDVDDINGFTPDETATSLDDIVNFADGKGKDGNGIWKLYIDDDQLVDSGNVAGGWTLRVQSVPTISSIANQTIDEDTTKAVSFTVNDNGGADSLSLKATSSNTGLLPNANITISGSGTSRVIEVTPKADQNGTATITITVDDGPVDSNGNPTGNTQRVVGTFNLTVTPKNDAPTITQIGNQTTEKGKAIGPFEIEINDGGAANNETPRGNLTVVVTSSNSSVVDPSDVFIYTTGNDLKRKILIAPKGVATGSANIKIKVTDNAADGGGGDNKSAETNFTVTVNNIINPAFASTTALNADGNIGLTINTGRKSADGTKSKAGKVKVVVANLNVANPENLILRLIAPNGSSSTLMAASGGANALSGVRVTFDDAARLPDGNDPGDDPDPKPLPNSTLIPNNDTFQPSNGGAVSGDALSSVIGSDLDGTWQLSVTGLQPGDSIGDGFVLIVEEGPVIPEVSLANGQATTNEDTPVDVSFIVSDIDSNVADIKTSATATGNAGLISKLETFGTGSNRTLRITPAANANGTATIQLKAEDKTAGSAGTTTFNVVINPVNDAPTITFIDKVTTTDGKETGLISFTVNDIDSAAGLVVTASSSNDKIVPIDEAHILMYDNAGTLENDADETPNLQNVSSGDTLKVRLVPVPQGNKGNVSTDITLIVRDGNNASSSRTFQLTVLPAESAIQVNSSLITIRDNNTANPTPSQISVSGLKGTIRKVSVTLVGATHEFPSDIDALLVGPDGTGVMLMSGVGGDPNLKNTQLTFDKDAGVNLPAPPTFIPSGSYIPTVLNGRTAPKITDTNNQLITPAGIPAGPFGTDLAIFTNKSPNGAWKLYITDSVASNAGTLAGWSINIVTQPAIDGLPDTITILEDQERKLDFTVGDVQGAANSFVVNATSDNAGLIPNASDNLSISGSGANRTLSIKSASNANSGSDQNNLNRATISVTVSDGTTTATKNIVVTVTPVNDTPTIAFVDQSDATGPGKKGVTTPAGIATDAIPFTIGDVETPNDLQVSASSSDTTVIPNSNIILGGSGANRTVQVVPNGSLSGRATITLTVAEKSGDKLSNSINFVLTVDGAVNSAFESTGGITIRDNTTAAPYPSIIRVGNRVGQVSKVRVVIEGFSHQFPEDVDMVLVGPNGKAALLMADVGGNVPVSGRRLMFDSGAANALDANVIQSGTYQPSNNGAASFPSPGPNSNISSGPNALNDAFIGSDPNGEWKLYVVDDTAPDSGSIAKWILILNSGPALAVSDLNQTSFRIEPNNNNNTSTYQGVKTNEDTSIDVGFTVGDSDTNPDKLTITARAQNRQTNGTLTDTADPVTGTVTGSDLVGVRWKTAKINDVTQFVDKDGKAITVADLPTKGIRQDLILSGSGSKRTLTIKPSDNKNTDGDKDNVDPSNDVLETIITLTVSDGVTTVTRQFILEANRSNDSPGLNFTGLSDGKKEVDEDNTTTVGFTFSDIETTNFTNDNTKFVATSSDSSILVVSSGNDNGVVIARDNNAKTGTLTLTPKANANGTVTVTLTMTDKDGGVTSKSFSLVVKSVNDNPVIGKKDNNGNIVSGVIDGVGTKIGTPVDVNFSVKDIETEAKSLTVTVSSDDTNLLPSSSFVETSSPGENRTIRITPAGQRTGNAQVTITVRDANNGTASATFTLSVGTGNGQTFPNPPANPANRIVFFDNAAASPYPSTVTVNNVVGTVRDVVVTLNKLKHSTPDDIDILLVAPGGRTAVIMSDAGGSNALGGAGVDITFSDSASNSLPDNGQITFGTFKPSNYEDVNDSFPGAPAPGNNGYGQNLSVFDGINPNGQWQLFVRDDGSNQTVNAEIVEGWSIAILTAPTLTNPGDQTIAEDVQGTFNITVNNQTGITSDVELSASSDNQSLVPNSKLTFAAGAGALRQINIQSAANANSGSNGSNKATITVTATDKITKETETISFKVTITPVNDAPVVSALPRNTVTLNEEEKTTIPFTVTDVENVGSDITVTAVSDNNGLIEINNSTDITGSGNDRFISIKPKANQTGNATITVTAKDKDNAVGTGSFLVSVSAVNDPPTIVAEKTDISTGSGEPVQVKFTVDDTETNPTALVVKATSGNTALVASTENGGLVVGALAAKDGKAEGTLTINPIPEKDGKVTITLEVSDGENKVTTTVLLTVRPSTNRIFENTAPITIQDNSASSPYPSNIEVSGLQGKLAKLSVTLNKINHSFPGDIDVLLMSPDGKTLVLMSDVGSSGRLTDVTLNFSDAGAGNLPTNAQITSGTYKPTDNDSQPGDLDNFPAPAPTTTPGDELADFNGIDPNGTWSLFIVDDAGGDSGMVSGGWRISIQTGPTISDIANQTTDEDTATKVTFTVSDQDTAAGSLTITAKSNTQSIVPDANIVAANDNGNASLTITPAANANGSVKITITVKDQDGHEATKEFNLTVTPINDAPVVSSVADQSTPTNIARVVNLTVSDAETASGSLTITPSSTNQNLVPNSSIAVANNNGAVTLTITPASGANGTTVITVTVADADGGSSKRSFTLSVIPATDLVFSNTDGITVNDISSSTPYPSVINVANRIGKVNKVVVSLEGLSHNFVSDMDVLLVGPSGAATILMSDVGGTRPVSNINLTFDDAAAGSLPVNAGLSAGTFKPTDGDGGQGVSDNLFPSPAPAGPYQVSLSVFNGTDPNGTWSLYIVDDTGQDAGTIAAWKLTITTLAPVISNVDDISTNEDTSTTVSFQISGGDAATVSATSSNLALIPNANLVLGGTGPSRTLTITPAANQTGTSLITLSISDGPKGDPQTQTITETFTVTVTPVNDGPTISALSDITLIEDGNSVVSITAQDVDSTNLSITATSDNQTLLPNAGLSVAGTGPTYSLTVSPAANASGSAVVTVTVTDEGGLTASTTFTVTVTPVNDAPAISAINPQTTPEDIAITIPFTVSDPDNAFSELEITAISISPELVPDSGLVISGVDGIYTLTVNPVANANGTAVLRIQASDGDRTTRRTFDLVITPVNDAPSIAPVATQTVEQDKTLTVVVTVTDIDSPAANLTASVLTLDPNLVPDGNITFTGPVVDPANATVFVYTLTITPASGVNGTAFTRFQIQDETRTVRQTIEVVITPPSRTDIVPPAASLSAPPATPGTGLNGSYWQLKPKEIVSLASNGLKIIRTKAPSARFVATDINYTGNDLTPVSEWLGSDATSLTNPNPGNLDDGLFHFTGFISIAQPGEWQFRSESDDGSIVWIGGTKIIDNDGSHGAPGPSPDGTAFFNAPGLYPIEIAYYNGDWTNDAGEHGGASILVTGGPSIQSQSLGSIGSLFYGSQDLEGLNSAPSSGVKESTGDAGTGLSGRYWKLPPGSVDSIIGGVGETTIANVLPNGYFTSTSVNYSGNDLTPVLDWLGSDSTSFRGLESNLDDGLFSFSGFIRIDEPGTVTFSTPSDDGSVVTIGGVRVIDNDGSHGSPGDTPDGKIFFGTPGLYPIEIAYYNGDWTNDAGEHGGANINFTSDGGGGIGNADATVPTAVLYPAENSFSLANQDIGVEGDPIIAGSADIRNPYPNVYDIDVVAGGSDIWGNDDSGHFVYTEWTGDFDAAVEVTRLDVINRWSKAGISVRETLDTGSRHVYVNVDSAAEAPKDDPAATGANTYEMGVRVDTNGGTGNWDENGGTPRMNVADSTLPAWIRVTRSGNKFTAYRSGDGSSWTEMGSIVQAYPASVFVSLGTTSHNNDGEDRVTTAHYRNFTIIPASPEIEPPVVQLSFANGAVTITWENGKLQSASSIAGPWSDVTVIPGRGQAPVPAESPYTSNAVKPAEFYRVVIE